MMQDVHVKLNLGLLWLKTGFNKKILFTCKLNLNLKEETGEVLHLERSFGAEMCTLRKVDQKYLDSFQM